MTTQKKAARFVRVLTDGWQGDVALYRCEPPHEGHEYVVASAVDVMFSGPETYLFGCDENGENIDWLDLPGSYRGGYSHDTAFRGAGYEVVR